MKTESKHTPGPWRWVVNPKSHHVTLERATGWADTVLNFVRWGMRGATPRFGVNGLMENAVDISIPQPGREHHADWWRIINHPDANLIAAAPELLEANSTASRVLSEAREMLGVLEDNGGHDGLRGEGYRATIDHIDEALKKLLAVWMKATGVA